MGRPVGETLFWQDSDEGCLSRFFCSGMALLYAHREDLKDSTRSVADLMNDHSPASMDLGGKVSETVEAEGGRMRGSQILVRE